MTGTGRLPVIVCDREPARARGSAARSVGLRSERGRGGDAQLEVVPLGLPGEGVGFPGASRLAQVGDQVVRRGGQAVQVGVRVVRGQPPVQLDGLPGDREPLVSPTRGGVPVGEAVQRGGEGGLVGGVPADQLPVPPDRLPGGVQRLAAAPPPNARPWRRRSAPRTSRRRCRPRPALTSPLNSNVTLPTAKLSTWPATVRRLASWASVQLSGISSIPEMWRSSRSDPLGDVGRRLRPGSGRRLD